MLRTMVPSAILGVVVACFPAQAFTVEPGVKMPQTVRYSCDPLLKTSFLKCFAIWNNVTGGYFTLIEDDIQPNLVLTTTRTSYFPVSIGDALGLSTFNPDIVWITWPFPKVLNLDAVMLHELGHEFGLGHSIAQDSVMLPYIFQFSVPVLTQDDINGIRSIYGLPAVESFGVVAKGTGRKRVFQTIYNATWDFGDGTPQVAGVSVTHKFAARGHYEVTATYLGIKQSLTVSIGRKGRP